MSPPAGCTVSSRVPRWILEPVANGVCLWVYFPLRRHKLTHCKSDQPLNMCFIREIFLQTHCLFSRGAECLLRNASGLHPFRLHCAIKHCRGQRSCSTWRKKRNKSKEHHGSDVVQCDAFCSICNLGEGESMPLQSVISPPGVTVSSSKLSKYHTVNLEHNSSLQQTF